MRLSSRTHRADLRGLSSRRLRARSGFTIAEVIVSILIITVGVLALASGSAGILRQMRAGNQAVLAANAAQLRVEDARSRSCASLTSGSAATRGMTEKWTISSVGTIKAIAETVTYQPRAGTTKKLGINGLIPCT